MIHSANVLPIISSHARENEYHFFRFLKNMIKHVFLVQSFNDKNETYRTYETRTPSEFTYVTWNMKDGIYLRLATESFLGLREVESSDDISGQSVEPSLRRGCRSACEHDFGDIARAGQALHKLKCSSVCYFYMRPFPEVLFSNFSRCRCPLLYGAKLRRRPGLVQSRWFDGEVYGERESVMPNAPGRPFSAYLRGSPDLSCRFRII